MLVKFDENLIIGQQNQGLNAVHERFVRDKNGALLRVRFVVVKDSGSNEFRPQIISVEAVTAPISSMSATSTPTAHVLLANPKIAQTPPPSPRAIWSGIISPYITLDFLMSQPTRAPSFN